MKDEKRNKVKKTFVLNPHAVLSSSESLLRFGEDNEVIVPMCVLEKIQESKGKYSFGKRKVAKDVLNYINNLGDDVLSEEGVIQENGSRLSVATNYHDIKIEIDGIDNYDRRALQVAKGLQAKGKNVTFITNNILLQIKAKEIGINAESFRDELYPVLSEQYKGRLMCFTSDEVIDEFYETGEIGITKIYDYEKYEFVTNIFVILKSEKKSAIGKVEANKIVKLKNIDRNIYGIQPKNVGQKFMLEGLMSNDPLVIIKGDAGTGKTFCTLAAALQQYDEGLFKQILVARPIQTVANEKIGYLPGDIDDKVGPYLGGIKDNLRELLRLNSSKKNDKDDSLFEERGEYFFERGIIRIQPIGYIRGRTIIDTFLIFDETQNIDPEDIKTIVSRMGEGSKLVFLGDPSQVDNPKLNERYNGLVYLSERMKGQELVYQVTLEEEESVRSKLARLAIKVL